ncbi:MAG: hypothetical protein IKV79_06725 [Oscillospiraceae bacterium]|nr:hypothetical protein [Oscillospiraceae bacterium]
MKKFVTETDVGYIKTQSYKMAAVIFVIATALACLCLQFSQKIFAALEIVIILACLMMALSKKHEKHHFRLTLDGRGLHVDNLAEGGSFSIPDLRADDIIIRQSKREEKLDYCTVLINGTANAFGGVKNCSGLREYISAEIY